MMNVNGLQVSKRNLSTVLYPKFHNSFFFLSVFLSRGYVFSPTIHPFHPSRVYQQPHPVIYPPVKRANRRGLRVSAFLPRANNGHADAGHR